MLQFLRKELLAGWLMKEVIPLHKKEAAEDTISAASKLRIGLSSLTVSHLHDITFLQVLSSPIVLMLLLTRSLHYEPIQDDSYDLHLQLELGHFHKKN